MIDATMMSSPGASETRSFAARLKTALFGADSYGLLFLFLIGDYIFLSVGWRGSPALVITAAWLSLTVLLAFRTSRVPRRVMDVIRVAALVNVLTALSIAIGAGERAAGAALLLSTLLLVASPIAIGWRIVHHQRVTAQTILGALCVYVLIGLIFANADYGIQLASGSSFFAQSGHHGPSDFAYFSFITMTTVGYGDLTPSTGLPRTSAVLDALTGQIFLVVLVARLVTMYTPTFGWRGESATTPPQPPPPSDV
jgi:Ion channel